MESDDSTGNAQGISETPYSGLTGLTFEEALHHTKRKGIGIYRTDWNGNADRETFGVRQFVQPCPTQHQAPGMTPFLVIVQPHGVTPWVPSQGDLFSNNWATL